MESLSRCQDAEKGSIASGRRQSGAIGPYRNDRVTSEKQRKTDYVCEDILDVDGFIPDNGIGGNKA